MTWWFLKAILLYREVRRESWRCWECVTTIFLHKYNTNWNVGRRWVRKPEAGIWVFISWVSFALFSFFRGNNSCRWTWTIFIHLFCIKIPWVVCWYSLIRQDRQSLALLPQHQYFVDHFVLLTDWLDGIILGLPVHEAKFCIDYTDLLSSVAREAETIRQRGPSGGKSVCSGRMQTRRKEPSTTPTKQSVTSTTQLLGSFIRDRCM